MYQQETRAPAKNNRVSLPKKHLVFISRSIRLRHRQGGTGKTGNWVINFPDRGNTGNLGTTQEKFGQHRKFSKFP